MNKPGCQHPRCGNREWHHPGVGRGFGAECAPFKLGANECECRVPAAYGTLPADECVTCGGTGYTKAIRNRKAP
jgi:hypothetical protein